MADIIFSLKNIVIVILVSEFMKQLMSDTKYKRYIDFAISLIVIGFVISAATGKSFNISPSPDFNYTEGLNEENLIANEYKNKIAERVAEKFPDGELPEFEIELDEKYTIVKIRVKTDYPDAEKIIKELGFTSYEIIN